MRCFCTSAHVIGLLLVLAACDTTEPVDPPPDEEETGLVAFFTRSIDCNRLRVAVAPFNDPTYYRFLSDVRDDAYLPLFTPDRSRLLFFAQDTTTSIVKLVLYDLARDTARSIHIWDGEFDMTSHIIPASLTWNGVGTGFFFDYTGSITDAWATHYYALDDGDSTAILLNTGAEPVVYLGQDTLLVKVTYESLLGLLDLGTSIHTPLNNPYLQASAYPGLRLSWNADRRLFVVSRPAPDNRFAAQLVLTNLDGSFFAELTSMGPHRDITPRWGPDGTVFFNRISETERSDLRCGSILLIDVGTGEERTWLRPENVEGADHLCLADY